MPALSKPDEFRQYAEEAMRSACQAKTEKEKWNLLELARTRSQAALASDSAVVVNDSRPERKAL